MRLSVVSGARTALIAVICAFCACSEGDVRTQAIETFHQLGLTFLEPARDYIVAGGLVTAPSNLDTGKAQYWDPPRSSTIPTEPKNFIPFKSIFDEFSKKGTTKLSIAVNLMKQILKFPVGVDVVTDSDVKMSQIDSNGIRMRTDAVDQYVADAAVANILNPAFPDGHAYVVLEVYQAKTMDIEGSGSSSLDVRLGNGGKPPDCTQASTNKSSTTSSGAQGSATDAGASGGSGQGAKTTGTGSSKGDTAESGGKSTKSSSQGTATGNTNSSTDEGINVSAGVCHGSTGTLKFNTDEPIQFLVRLVEVKKDPKSGQLSVMRTKFTWPKTLGASPAESLTAQPSGDPVIKGLQHAH